MGLSSDPENCRGRLSVTILDTQVWGARMLLENFLEQLDPVLKELGHQVDAGEEFRDPPLDIERYYHRPRRLHWLPVVGRGLGVVAVVRQPLDVGFSALGYSTLLERLGLAVNGRFSPRLGLSVGLSVIVITPEPIQPTDEDLLGKLSRTIPRTRVTLVGLFRLNLGQEAMASLLTKSPFAEPAALHDFLASRFRQFVPIFQEDTY